jgi:hypothetical protein
LLISLCAASVNGQPNQPSFANLGFESAQVAPSPPTFFTYAPVASAIPVWTVEVGGVQTTQVIYNGFYGSTAGVALFGPGWTQQAQNEYHYGVLDGNYTVLLESGGGLGTGEFGNASIAQTGFVPFGTQSLQFETGANSLSIYGGLTVSFDGSNLPLTVVSTGQSSSGLAYDVMGADIAPYAGQVGQLEFTSGISGAPDGYDYAYVLLDDITFSPQTVPEPTILSLTLISGLLCGARKWRAGSNRWPT